MALWLLALATLLGVRHAFAPDHVAAVSTFTEKTEATRRQGVVYALRIAAGHSAGMLAEAGVLLGLLVTVPVAWDMAMTWGAAIWLLLMALWLLWDLVRGVRRRSHGQPAPHLHLGNPWVTTLQRPIAAWGIGLLFGLAVSPGDLAVFTIMAKSYAHPVVALGYLAAFLAAMFAGLAGVGGGLGWANTRPTLRRVLQGLSGVGGLGVAVALMSGMLH